MEILKLKNTLTKTKHSLDGFKKVAFFIISKGWKQSKCSSSGKWINSMWYIHTVGYYQ